MDTKILDFVNRRISERLAARLGVIPASEEVVATEQKRIRDAFGLELPEVYIEICRRTDGLTGENGETMYGLGTYFGDDSEYPDYEGLMEVHERFVIDVGEPDLLEFGNRFGTDPWGWHFAIQSFVSAFPGGRDVIRQFASFEEMFLDLFGLNEYGAGA